MSSQSTPDVDRKPVLSARALTKRYSQMDSEDGIEVLNRLDLDVHRGERIAIVGRSGSGKSTLLHILAGLDEADHGSVIIDSEDMLAADANGRARLRAANMGFVYQNHHLLPEFTALENVAMPLRIAGATSKIAQTHARRLLGEVGLSERLSHLPSQLSGGERARTAVARALTGQPRLVLADEPTGNLDAENAAQVMALIESLSLQHNVAFVVVTHDANMLENFDRVLTLHAGKLVG